MFLRLSITRRQATLEQGDLEDWIFTDSGACVGVLDAEPGLGHTALSKTLPSASKPLVRVDSESSDSSGTPAGRWRRSIPKSWKAPKVRMDHEYSYDAASDVHTINPVHDSVIDVDNDLAKSTLVVKTDDGSMTIPIKSPFAEFQHIFEVHNIGTQTDGLAFHGFQEDFESIDDDHIDVVDEQIIVQEEIVEPSVSSDEQIIVREEIMEYEMEAFVEGLLQEGDVVWSICKGTGKYDSHDGCPLCEGLGGCPLCEGLGKLLNDGDDDHQCDEESETIYAIGDQKPERYGSTDADWQHFRITLESGSMVDVTPNDELCQVEAVPCTGSRRIGPANTKLYDMFIQTCTSDAMTKVETTPGKEQGFEAWRRLARQCEPTSRLTRTDRPNLITVTVPCSNMKEMLSKVGVWEQA